MDRVLVDSGVDWIGSIPAGWGVQQIRQLSPVKRGASPRPIDDSRYFDEDGEWSWVRIADVSASQGRLLSTSQKLSSLGSSLSVKLEPGALFVSIAGTVGKPCITEIKACIHDGFVYFPRLQYSTEFLYRIFEAGKCYEGLGKMGTQLNLNTDTIGSIRVPVPSIDEQGQIVQYLVESTAKIDVLIEKQERLIEMLAERRQALISHAVTKGLDPNASMRATGIEWIGEIPDSWKTKRVSWLFRTVGSGTTPPSGDVRFYGKGTPWVTTGELRESTIIGTSKSVTTEALAAFPTLRVYGPGTLLIAMYGATIGRLGELGISACTNQACCAMSDPIDVLTRFAYYSLLAAKEHVLVLAVGGGQPNINQETIRALRLPTPPVSEQKILVDFLDHETARMDALSAKASEMIDILKERRQALISAAVTGKIDVRGLS